MNAHVGGTLANAVVSWEQTLVVAMVTALITGTVQLVVGRWTSGVTERAAERGAKAAVENTTVTAAAMVHAAEVQRQTQREQDVRASRREQVGTLLKTAVAREQTYRAVGQADRWPGATTWAGVAAPRATAPSDAVGSAHMLASACILAAAFGLGFVLHIAHVQRRGARPAAARE